MLAHSFGIFSDHIDTYEIASHWLWKVNRMIQISLDVRALKPDRFFDVSYYDLVELPLDVLAGLWHRIGPDRYSDRVLTRAHRRRIGKTDDIASV